MINKYLLFYSKDTMINMTNQSPIQIDHEELERMLQTSTADRDKTRATGKSPGISGFFKDKMNDFKGVDPEKTRRERIEKLETEIQHVRLSLSLFIILLKHHHRPLVVSSCRKQSTPV